MYRAVTGANLEESLFRLVAHHGYKDFPECRAVEKILVAMWKKVAVKAKLPMVVPGHEDSTFGNIFASHVKSNDCTASMVNNDTECMAKLNDDDDNDDTVSRRPYFRRQVRQLLPDLAAQPPEPERIRTDISWPALVSRYFVIGSSANSVMNPSVGATARPIGSCSAHCGTPLIASVMTFDEPSRRSAIRTEVPTGMVAALNGPGGGITKAMRSFIGT